MQVPSPKIVRWLSLIPGNGDWFEQDKELRVFERLRRQSPVHLTEEANLDLTGPLPALRM